jgi:hypothetical protein
MYIEHCNSCCSCTVVAVGDGFFPLLIVVVGLKFYD